MYVLNARVMQKVYEDSIDVNSAVLDTIPLINSSATVTLSENTTPLASYNLSNDAEFKLQVDSSETYMVTGMKEGYFTSSTLVSTAGIHGKPGDTLNIFAEVVLNKIPTSSTTQIKLSNIYYDYDDTTLRAESFPELENLVKLLNDNPTLPIQINSHTDARGGDKYNNKLSQGRANSVVSFLTGKGINSNRLAAKGWGETQLENRCDDGVKCTEEEHQLNRRTTFNVLSSNFNLRSEAPISIL